MGLGEMNNCEYSCEFHRYKPTGAEWHHPISSNGLIGIYLCELHHSIICGRKKRDPLELIVNKSLDEMRMELKELERRRIIEQGGNPNDIDKH